MFNLLSFIEDYLVDQDDGMRKLLTWFMNFVMEQEALHQANDNVTKELIHVKKGTII